MRTAIRRFGSVLWLPLCGAIALSGVARALDAPGPLDELDDADRKALETIAGNSAELRDAILKASLYVDTLVETQRIQEQSSASFQERIAKLDRKQQEQVWEIVREPGLLQELATEKPPTAAQLDAIAKRHPEKVAASIRELGAKQHDLFTDVARIHGQASDRFEARIADLPDDAKQAFRDLLGQPELLTMAVDRVRLMVRLGDSYRADPEGTRRYLSGLSAQVAKSNEAAQQEWVQTLEKDPQAAAEFEQSAREYSEENGYDYDELTSPDVRTKVTVVVNPYPYWFGYPVWYSDLYLYPYGYWYPYPPYFGYYYYRHHFVWWGLPSIAYTNWFFFGHHHHHFSHLSHCFDRHFHGHPFARDSFHNSGRNWATWRDPVDQHRGGGRGDWSNARWERPSGRGGGGTLAARDNGTFFNRNVPADRWSREGGWSRGRGRAGGDPRFRDGVDRVAPGERGPSIGGGLDGRGRRDRGQVATPDGRGRDARNVRVSPPAAQPDAGEMPVTSPRNDRGGEGARSSRGRRDGISARQQQPAPVVETPQVSPQPQQDRGAASDSRRGFRGGDRGRRDRPSFQGAPSPAQAPAAQQQTSPRGRDRSMGGSSRSDGGGRRSGSSPAVSAGPRDSGGAGIQSAPRGGFGGRGGGGGGVGMRGGGGGRGGGDFGMRGGGGFGGRGGGGFGGGGGRPSGRGR